MLTKKKDKLMAEMGIAFKREPCRNDTFFVDVNNPIPAIIEARLKFLNRFAKFREKDELVLYFKVIDSNDPEVKILRHLHDCWDGKSDVRSTFNLNEKNLTERKEYLLREFYELYDEIRDRIILKQMSDTATVDVNRKAKFTLINGGAS